MKSALWAIAVILVLAGGAAADDLETQLSSIFDQLDQNADGVVTADEVNEEQSRHFNRLLRRGDADENGELTRDEFIAATAEQDTPVETPAEETPRGGAPDEQRMAITSEMLARLDADSDGIVTLEEIPEDVRPRFARLFERLEVTEIELSRLRELAQRQQQLLAERGDDPPAGDRPRGEEGDRPEGDRPPADGERPSAGNVPRDGDAPREGNRPIEGRPMGEFRGPEFFRRLDENGDRRLSEGELARFTEIFGELDRNTDGQLDMAELMGFPPQDGAGGPQRGFGGPRPEGFPRTEDNAPRPDGVPRPGLDVPRTEDNAPRPDGVPRPGLDVPRTEDNAPRPDGVPRPGLDVPRTEDNAPRPDGVPRPGLDVPRTEDNAPRPETPRVGDIPRTEDAAPRPEGSRPLGGAPRDFNPRQFFNALDTDGNGFLSEEETPQRLRASFDDADTDDDGQLSAEELLGHMQRQQGGDRGTAPSFDTFWSSLDRNNDGFVTTDEMPEGRSELMLERADANDDGKLSRDELRAVMPRGPRPEGERGADRPDGERPEAERGEGDGERDGDQRPDADR